MSVRQVHRYISLAVAAIWLVQAVTGTLSVFRWEIDDWTVGGAPAAVDYSRVGARIDQLDQSPDTSVSSVWTSGSAANRFDVHHKIGDAGRVMRIDGQGRILRVRSSDWVVAEGAFWDSVTKAHTTLWAGDAGEWLIGLSGFLLLTNIGLGLKLAWPKRGTWGRTLFGAVPGKSLARLYGWHRKVGLWFALPALFTVSAGTLMVFASGVERLLGAELSEPAITSAAVAGSNIGTGPAIEAALDRYPQASFSGIYLPSEDSPWYRIRLRNAGEVPRKWGTTVVFVGAGDGRVLKTYDAARPEPRRAIVDTLYALHTGQAGGLPGRLIVLSLGLALVTLISLGIPLWWKRRKARAG